MVALKEGIWYGVLIVRGRGEELESSIWVGEVS